MGQAEWLSELYALPLNGNALRFEAGLFKILM